MISRFDFFLASELKFQKTHRILITVSGGVDSMVLLHLFQKTKHHIAVAHCNFNLRGKESEDDYIFVKNYCLTQSIPFFEKKFDVGKYQLENKKGIQESARELRYTWFNEIALSNNYEFIATAHHLSDIAETLLLNISRGTGITGLHGIKPINGKIIRPLLFAKKEEIISYANQNNIHFRSDSSNDSNKYSRNKIRNTVIPILKEINPKFEEHVLMLTKNIFSVEKIYKLYVTEKWNNVHTSENGIIKISIPLLLEIDDLSCMLFEFLQPFNFNYFQSSQIFNSLNEQSGKKFYSKTHILIKDRDFLILSKLNLSSVNEIQVDQNTCSVNFSSTNLTFEYLSGDSELIFDDYFFYLDADLISFPLIIRKWQKGDLFTPLGMKNNKKVSDFFIDKKISLIDKENALLICTSNNDIICIVPHRIDDHYKLTSSTKNILKISFTDY